MSYQGAANRNNNLAIIDKNIVLAMMLFVSFPAFSEGKFNLDALSFDSPITDQEAIKQFLDDNALKAGSYLTLIYFNNEFVEKRVVEYVLSADKSQLLPLLTRGELQKYGVNVSASAALHAMSDRDIIDNIAAVVPQASYNFSMRNQRLDIKVPQMAINQQVRGYIPPEQWESGLPAAMLGYYYSGSQTHYVSGASGAGSENYLNLNSGINLLGWRLRNNSSLASGEGWENISTSLSHDLQALRAQLTLGDTVTPADIFDSMQVRGVKVESDTDMLPYSQQGFAPVIRGIARSDAQVTVRQNGYTIYQAYVTQGPFAINDINQIASGTDFDVTVKEADGSEHTFIQSSASLPVMQREGNMQYSVVAGRYQYGGLVDEPDIALAQLIYGLPWGATLYGGVMGNDFYRSAALGLGVDLHDAGSMSVDATHARGEINDSDDAFSGVSWRVQYAKNLDATNTNLTLAGYRYSTRDFYTFNEIVGQRNQAKNDDDYGAWRGNYNRHRRLQVNLSQSLGNYGSFFLSGYQQDYWGLAGRERNLTFGYNTAWDGMTFSLNVGMTQTPESDTDRQITLGVSVPLDRWLPGASANYSVSQARHSDATHQLGISGNAFDDNRLSWNVQQSFSAENSSNGGSAGMTWQGSAGVVSTGYYYNNDSQQLNYSLRGGIVAHPYGVTLAQSLSESQILIKAEGAKDVKVMNRAGVVTDSRGYAVLPYATPYRKNQVSLDTRSASQVDIAEPVRDVVPSRGALVLAEFTPQLGDRVLLTLLHNGQPLTFGTLVSKASDGDNAQASLVGDHGEVYLTGMKANDTVIARWGQGESQQCQATLQPDASPRDHKSPVILQTLDCR